MKPVFYILIALIILPLPMQGQRRKKNTTPVPLLQDSLFHELKWRNIGPFRGGRSVAATGVVGQPMTYYMGTTGGGIWKTVDDGITWKNCSDGFLNTGTVGALAVAESNPNIIVAGMGEHAARGVMTSMGDGIYKSTDGGKHWKHMGLDYSRHISDVIIHPSNPDIIFVAVQGAQYGPSEDRGIYKSIDGGEHWEKVLYKGNTVGASSLSMDMKNPQILYASLWQHRRFPWKMESGGERSGLYKSEDGGENWTKMSDGLPKTFGKSGISVSRANPERVYAVLEAEGKKGGVYRSDDAGKKWKQLNKNRIAIARSWYYMEIFADPKNENIVYVLNAPMLKSIDGGKSFSPVPTPHGDNHHLWINPNNPHKMINANDGGANISNNGGLSWSTQQNQPTSQFYRVITDHQVPYMVYGGQQDNSAIAIASRTNDNGIDWKDWYAVAGCESAYLAFDPDKPNVVYGGCYQGIIERWVKASQTGKPINEYPELSLGNAPKDFKFRYNWNAPIISSPHDPNTIYHAGNVVFKTNNGGTTWEVISPDLTRNIEAQQGPGGGPFTNEAAGGENYHTLMYLTESIHEKGVLWAGSDDGLVHITKNGGESWTNVTPKNLPEGIINSIEVSPHDPATAYIAVMRYKSMDLKPYIFKTSDYGITWSAITNGITGEHTFVRVVREDPKRKGLLYAGTETGLFISWNDGQNWQPFQLNLPVVPINDISLWDNDLIVATAGRSFWILDDVASLQYGNSAITSLQIFPPKNTYRILGGSTTKPVPGLGQNSKQGITFDYYLPKNADSLDLKLEILEGDSVLRTYTNVKPKEFKSWPGGPAKPDVLPSKKGYHRFTWDFRRETLPAINKVFVFGDYKGARVAPGTYTLRLTLEDTVVSTSAVLLPNPKVNGSPEDFEAQQTMLVQLENMVRTMHTSVNQMRSAKKQLQSFKKLLAQTTPAKPLLQMGDSLIKRITQWEESLIQPHQKTFQDVINFNNQLNAQMLYLKGFIDTDEPRLTQGAKTRFADLMADWEVYQNELDAIINVEMQAYNAQYKTLNLPAIVVPDE